MEKKENRVETNFPSLFYRRLIATKHFSGEDNELFSTVFEGEDTTEKVQRRNNINNLDLTTMKIK